MVTGFTHYKGFRAAQHENFGAVFGPFLQEQNFEVIIEIGTLNGGLTRYLKDASPNSRIVSYDVCSQPEHSALIELGIEVKMINIFGDRNVKDEEALSILNSNKKKLMLCDGGNKAAEFNCLVHYMKSGDFIMGHDYARSMDFFNKEIQSKVWNWCELEESHIINACGEYGLVDHERDLFQSIAWVCKKKP